MIHKLMNEIFVGNDKLWCVFLMVVVSYLSRNNTIHHWLTKHLTKDGLHFRCDQKNISESGKFPVFRHSLCRVDWFGRRVSETTPKMNSILIGFKTSANY